MKYLIAALVLLAVATTGSAQCPGGICGRVANVVGGGWWGSPPPPKLQAESAPIQTEIQRTTEKTGRVFGLPGEARFPNLKPFGGFFRR